MTEQIDRLLVGGTWVEPSADARHEVINPATEEPVARVPLAEPADIDRGVQAARRAFDEGDWRRRSPSERADILADFAQRYQARVEDFATAMTLEMGAPITQARMMCTLPTMVQQYYIDLVRRFAFEERREGQMGDVLVRHEPVGVVAAIVPWNGPQYLATTKLMPALAAGCSVIVKPAPETPLDAAVLAEVVADSAIPPGVVSILPAHREVGAYLVGHPGVDKVAFTGSVEGGRRVAELAGAGLKSVSLELGGKSAAVVLDDADPAMVAEGLKFFSFANNGQVCVAQTRVLIPRERSKDYLDAMVNMVGEMTIGDPMDPLTDVGPLVSSRQRDRVERYLSIGRDEGARVVVGGHRPPTQSRGWYIEPTIFADVDNTMTVAREEIFGPVIAVMPYDNVEQAIALANDTDYGLAGTVWTNDQERGIDVLRQIDAGVVGINGLIPDPSAPFGGRKNSGIGSELGVEGLREYLLVKAAAGLMKVA